MQRYNRTQFILVQLLIVCAFSVAVVVTKLIRPPVNIGIVILFTLLISSCVITIMAIIKRLRDLGFSGFWVIAVVLLSLLTRLFPDLVAECVDTGIILFFALMPGSEGENKYGLPTMKRWSLC